MRFTKIKKRVLGLLAGVSVLVCSVTPAFAQVQNDTSKTDDVVATSESIQPRAGTETWYGSGYGGSYTFTNYNLTPVKTMGKSGTLVISGSFKGNDGYADVSPIKLTAQIRSTSGAVRASTVVVDDRSGAKAFVVSCAVSKGDTIQLYFDASSVANPPGIYRSAYIEYDYAII